MSAEESWPQGYGLTALEETDSTNLQAARMASAAAGPVWITARRQTAARGRRGRPWAMPDGNFAATLLLPDPGPAERAALRSFVASLALYDAFLAAGVPAPALALKWPNDVLLNGGKVAGILLESGGHAGRVDWLALGFGVNLIAAPDAAMVEPGALSPVSVLAETGLRIERDDLLRLLAAAFARHEATFRSRGFDPLRRLWLSRAARLGEPITARTMAETTTGIFDGIDEQGALILRSAAGRRAIPAADVFFQGG